MHMLKLHVEQGSFSYLPIFLLTFMLAAHLSTISLLYNWRVIYNIWYRHAWGIYVKLTSVCKIFIISFFELYVHNRSDFYRKNFDDDSEWFNLKIKISRMV